MTSSEFLGLCKECENMLRTAAPYKTGNLRYNAINIEIVGNTCKLYVDEKIAPYMKYTNEPWTNGKKNPNEGWFDRVAEKIVNYLMFKLQGTVMK